MNISYRPTLTPTPAESPHGWAILDQQLTHAQILGMVTVLSSVWLAQRAQRRATPVEPAHSPE